MRIISVIAVAVVLSVGWVLSAEAASDVYRKAESLIDAGKYIEAEDYLKEAISRDPGDARLHHLLGDALKRDGRLKGSLVHYEKARKLGGENPELLKSMGTVNKWMKRSSTSKKLYKRALELKPDDREAKADLEGLKIDRGLQFRGWIGGWEADYTKEAYEGMLSYGGIDQLDLYGGYSFSNQVFYERSKFYASGYYFYNPRSYLKLYFAFKDYNYPVAKTPVPDENSYDKVPTYEAEAAHWFRKDIRGTLIYEFFRPSFFHDKDSTANNHKITGELYYITPLEYLKLKVIYAILRDPDPDKTTIKGRGGATATDVQYQTQQLLGGAVEIDMDRFEAEFRILPNRDLDNSYEYSVLTFVSYDFTDRFTGRLDYLYDKYSSDSSFADQTANVYMASGFYEVNDRIKLGAGLKQIDVPTQDETTGFISVHFKTGFGI